MEPDIWIQQNGDIYEYISLYVENLAIYARNIKRLMDALKKKYKVKIKWKGKISSHLAYDFFCDSDSILCFPPKIYIGKIVQTYMTMFGTKPKIHKYAVDKKEKGYNPYLDIS